MKRTLRSVLAAALVFGPTACAEGPTPPAGPPVKIDVAALNLTGVGDVVWDLEVVNGAPETVWQRR
ncbi:MAG: hypothetical protein EP329_16020, partial [Deltaproteobacteria bacterium]